MLMHGLTDQLSATKENAQKVNSRCFPCCNVRGGSRGSALLHPATYFLEVCVLPTSILHSLGNVQWIQNKPTIGKNWQIPWLQNLHLCTYWEKNGNRALSASGGSVLFRLLKLPCSQERQRLLVPAEVSVLRWRVDAVSDSFQNCLPHRGQGFISLWDC